MIRPDFKEDIYSIKIQQDELAPWFYNIRYFSNSVCRFEGYPVSTLYEGNNPVDIVLRLEQQYRQDTEDLETSTFSRLFQASVHSGRWLI
jgi:multidrug efflux pump subunit AcrB